MKNLLSLLTCILIICSCSNDDNTSVQSIESPAIEAITTVTVTEDLDGFLGVDDILTYSIAIKNIGDVELSGTSINTSLKDLDNNSLTLTTDPNFISADSGSSEGNLQVNETATYSATYTITQSDVDAGGLAFSATAGGISPEGENVNDVSDNDDDSDGNNSNDPTVTIIELVPLIIAEYHELNNDGDPYLKYYFDNNGQLYKMFYSGYPTPDVDLIYNFEFDSDQKLTNITKTDIDEMPLESIDFIYDSANRIVSVGDRHYEYITEDPVCIMLTESYQEDIYISGDLEFTEIYYTKYDYISDTNPIPRACNYEISSTYNLITDEVVESYTGCNDSFWTDYIGGNATGKWDNALGYIDYSHDSNINPLYSTTNLIAVYGFMYEITGSIYYGPTLYDPIYHLFSQNNITDTDDDLTSEFWDIEYIFNDNSLPVSSTYKYTFVYDVEPARPYANYYYHGDEIPE